MMNRESSALPIGKFIRSHSRTLKSRSEIKQEKPDISTDDSGLKTLESKRQRMEVAKIVTISDGVQSSEKGATKGRKNEWNEKETLKFYKALSSYGTDFQMMGTMFKNRTRRELLSKFKREDRHHAELVSKALQNQVFAVSESEEEKKPDLL